MTMRNGLHNRVFRACVAGAKEPELNNLFCAGCDGVVPVAVEEVSGKGY
jgi:hypothetical protein